MLEKMSIVHNAEDILYSLDKWLETKRISTGEIVVTFHGGWVKDGIFLSGTSGKGKTFSEACEDYLKKIRGKTLVFNPHGGDYKEEIIVL